MIYLIVFLVFTHAAAFGFGWIVGDVRASDRTNRLWAENAEWKRITATWGAWMVGRNPHE